MKDVSIGCSIAFRDISYSVDPAGKNTATLKVLSKVSGLIKAGEMCALMGSSGAGKTTLLDILANRKTVGMISGDVLFNGSPRTGAVSRASSYVMQDNMLIGVLTVRESLVFAARLRISEKMSAASRDRQVNKVLDMLGLIDVADCVVGDENIRGLSGGECRRLSIGIELVNLPDILYLDGMLHHCVSLCGVSCTIILLFLQQNPRLV